MLLLGVHRPVRHYNKVGRSRAAAVLELYCPHFEIPIVVDGYGAYKRFKSRQRCWVHVLREAELLAAIRGGTMEELHKRLQGIFHDAKQLTPSIGEAGLQGRVEAVKQIVQIYTEMGCKFGGKLHNAAPDLFTFVLYPGMPPTNNKSERTLRRVVMQKKIRLTFQSITGMFTYSILMMCMMTWHENGENLVEKIHETIIAN